MSGVAESEVAKHVELAADELEEALKAAHQHRKSKRLRAAVKRAGSDMYQLLNIFPDVRDEIEEDLA